MLDCRNRSPWPLVLCALMVLPLPSVRAEAAAPAAPADPELEVLAQSLASSQRASVDAAVGGLGRLPRYRLDLDLDADRAVLHGRAQVVVPVAEALSELYFRIPANAQRTDRGEVAVTVAHARRAGEDVDFERERAGIYRLPLVPPAQPGATVELEFEFVVQIPALPDDAQDAEAQLMTQAMSFLGGSLYPDQGRASQMLGTAGGTFLLAGFFPELVRRANGTFDNGPEPTIGEPRWGPLAHYTVSLVTPFAVQVAGTGTEIGQTPERTGRKRTTRVAAAVRGLALVAAPGLTEQRGTADGVRVRVLARPGHEEQGRKLLDVATRALRFYATRFGPYPWADLELAEAPLMGGNECVAFPGLLAASALLLDPAQSLRAFVPNPGSVNDGVLEMAIAHQLAHQWWRGVVGSDGRDRPVLDEPLAVYSAVLYVEQRRGQAAAKQLLESQVRNGYRVYRMLGNADGAVDRPLTEYSGRAEIAALLQGKGVQFYVALRRLLGDAAFQAAVREYGTTSRFRDVETDGVLLAVAGIAPNKAAAALKLHDRYLRGTFGDDDLGGALDLGEALRSSGMQVDPATQQMLDQLQGMLGGSVPVRPAKPTKKKGATGP